MQISYFHVPAEMPQDLRPDAAVVIDVLRATTTIASVSYTHLTLPTKLEV